MALVVGKPLSVVFQPLVPFFFFNVGWSELPRLSLIPTTPQFFNTYYYIWSNLSQIRVIPTTFGVLKKQARIPKSFGTQKSGKTGKKYVFYCCFTQKQVTRLSLFLFFLLYKGCLLQFYNKICLQITKVDKFRRQNVKKIFQMGQLHIQVQDTQVWYKCRISYESVYFQALFS